MSQNGSSVRHISALAQLNVSSGAFRDRMSMVEDCTESVKIFLTSPV